MKVAVERNCCNYLYDERLAPLLIPTFEKLANEAGLTSLDYFVIADTDVVNYCESVKKYASILDTEASVTQDGNYFTTGKTISGVDEDGKLHQAIVIKSGIWEMAAIEYAQLHELLPKEVIENPEVSIGAVSLILHEFGHAIDEENRFSISGTKNKKTQYDLSHEFDEYIRQTALSLWGEYFAESFACKNDFTLRSIAVSNTNNLLDCIKSYSLGTDFNSQLERVYRILYYFMFVLAESHQQSTSKIVSVYEDMKQDPIVAEYISLFMRAERAIIGLRQDYPKWDSYDRTNDYESVIKDLLQFERRRQW